MSLIITFLGKDRLTTVSKRAIKSFGRLGTSVAKVSLKLAKLAAVGAIAIGGIGVKLAADMEKGLREIGTLMGGLSDNEMRVMGHQLESIASSSGKAMDTLVKARYDIVSAGFSGAAASATLLEESARLAVGGVTEVSVAADLLTTTLNAYNLTAEQSANVSDKLFTIVRLGKTTVSELGSSLGRVVAIAGQTGISLDEVGAAVASLTAQGLDSARAVTSLQGAIIQILKPTEIMKGVIQDLGFATGEALLEQRGFAESLSMIKARADELELPLSEVFGSIEALQAVLPLTGTAAEGFRKNLEEMQRSAGATAEAFEEMQKSFSTQAAMLKQNVANVLRAIGRALIEIIQPGVEQANKLLSELGDIGWESVAKAIADNWRQIATRMLRLVDMFSKMLKAKLVSAFTFGEIDMTPYWVNMGRIAAETFDFIRAGAKVMSDEYLAALDEIEEKFDEMGGTVSTDLNDPLGETGDLLIDMDSFMGNFTSTMASAAVGGDDLKSALKKATAQLAIMVVQAVLFKAIMESVPGMKTVGAIEKGISWIGGLFKQSGGAVPQYLVGGGRPRGTDTIPAMLTPGEIVSTRKAADVYGADITRMNQMAETGFPSSGMGGGVSISIVAVDGASVARVLRRNPQEFAAGIKDLLRRKYLDPRDFA